MTHPNAMVAWDDIACQRHHDHHAIAVQVDLAKPHGFFDYPQVPARLARSWQMMIWDPQRHPVDGGPYCPAHDAVSATIVQERIWEPRETILAAQVMSTAEPGWGMLDLGAQLGWYTLLAQSYGLPTLSVDADADNLRLLERSIQLNGGDAYEHRTLQARIGPSTLPVGDREPDWTWMHSRFVKLDLEGAEEHAVRMLWGAIEEGRIDHMLMEVSPCFADGYPELVQRMIEAGYRAYILPEKHQPPWALDDLPADLEEWRLDGHVDVMAFVATWHQEDIWLAREGASW